jgi:hypothetical protein
MLKIAVVRWLLETSWAGPCLRRVSPSRKTPGRCTLLKFMLGWRLTGALSRSVGCARKLTLQASPYRMQVGAKSRDCHSLRWDPAEFCQQSARCCRITSTLRNVVHRIFKEVAGSKRFEERLCPNSATTPASGWSEDSSPPSANPSIIKSNEIVSIDFPNRLIKRNPPRMTSNALNEEIHDDGAPSPGIKRVFTGQKAPHNI